MPNNQGHGAPLCASLAIVFHLLDTLPSFPANLTYQSTSPMITGFTPEVYAQHPWLGLHSLDLTHTPCHHDSCRKAEDVLKEAIFCSTGGNAATAVSTGPSASTSTAPKQPGCDADEHPSGGISSNVSCCLSCSACSPTKCKHALDLPLRMLLTVQFFLFLWTQGSGSDHRSR